ncbi:MAG: hypothetical protein HC921_21715 [Synechococcaceae cyanobacterium SM2_3_1]|nr:hypothetical protein [Synechococcaceae cyanobacterium SM2_3_1]
MDISVYSRAHRILRNLRNYKPLDVIRHDDFYSKILDFFQGQDEVIGVYENPPNGERSFVLIGENRLLIWDGKSIMTLDYKNICEIENPSEKSDFHKSSLDSLQLKMKSGDIVTIFIRGSDENSRDIYPFMRFLMRVVSDLN